MKRIIKGIPFILSILILSSLIFGIVGCSSQITVTPPVVTTTVTTTATSTYNVTTTLTPAADVLTTTMMTTPTGKVPGVTPVSISGYLTTEDDFAANLGADTANMVHMSMMAASGLGITRKKADNTWEFYYLSGTFTSTTKINGIWTFNGTGAQLDAWNIVSSAASSQGAVPVPITVTGVLTGDTSTNPGMDADGMVFPVITVSSVAQLGTWVNFTGYITTEDDFAANLGADTANMVHMSMMAASGLGITKQNAAGNWEFYFLSGTITSGDNNNGSWTFNGTGGQLEAWNIVTAAAAVSPDTGVQVNVTGFLAGDTGTNPGMDADGLYFPVLTEVSLTKT